MRIANKDLRRITKQDETIINLGVNILSFGITLAAIMMVLSALAATDITAHVTADNLVSDDMAEYLTTYGHNRVFNEEDMQ